MYTHVLCTLHAVLPRASIALIGDTDSCTQGTNLMSGSLCFSLFLMQGLICHSQDYNSTLHQHKHFTCSSNWLTQLQHNYCCSLASMQIKLFLLKCALDATIQIYHIDAVMFEFHVFHARKAMIRPFKARAVAWFEILMLTNCMRRALL